MSVICLAACAIAVLLSLGLLIRKVRTPISVAVAFLLFGLAVSLGSAADRCRVDPGLDLAPVPLLSALALTGLMTFRLYRPRTMTGIAWVVLGISASGVVALCIGLAGMFSGNAHLYAVMDGFVSIMVSAGALAFFRRLDELSRRMGLSRHQVSELLNDRMGVSYSSFINGFRIDAARGLLGSRPDLTILAVALEVGFRNKTSFNDAFRRQVGITPSEYRRRQAGVGNASG